MFERLDRTPPWMLPAFAWALTGAITWLDYWMGYEESSSIFYLLPIFLAAWKSLLWGGLPVGLACGAGWWIADRAAGHTYSSGWMESWNVGSRSVTFLVVAWLFGALAEALRRQRLLARTDPVTGAANPRHFQEVLTLELARSARSGAPFTLAYLDLDDFKQVNDVLGHSAGDLILARTAEALRGGVRAIDTVARLGGDEFAVLFPETDEAEAGPVLARLSGALASAVADFPRRVTFSVGVVSFREPPSSVDDALRAADDLMYEVKRSGKAGLRAVAWPG